MIRRLLAAWIVMAVAIALTAWLLPDVDINGGILAALWIAALLGFINASLGTILRLLTLPLNVLTLGLFSLVVNALMVELTSHLSSHFDVHGFWAAFWASILISIISTILGLGVNRFQKAEP
jgi:putative membrane protein